MAHCCTVAQLRGAGLLSVMVLGVGSCFSVLLAGLLAGGAAEAGTVSLPLGTWIGSLTEALAVSGAALFALYAPHSSRSAVISLLGCLLLAIGVVVSSTVLNTSEAALLGTWAIVGGFGRAIALASAWQTGIEDPDASLCCISFKRKSTSGGSGVGGGITGVTGAAPADAAIIELREHIAEQRRRKYRCPRAALAFPVASGLGGAIGALLFTAIPQGATIGAASKGWPLALQLYGATIALCGIVAFLISLASSSPSSSGMHALPPLSLHSRADASETSAVSAVALSSSSSAGSVVSAATSATGVHAGDNDDADIHIDRAADRAQDGAGEEHEEEGAARVERVSLTTLGSVETGHTGSLETTFEDEDEEEGGDDEGEEADGETREDEEGGGDAGSGDGDQDDDPSAPAETQAAVTFSPRYHVHAPARQPSSSSTRFYEEELASKLASLPPAVQEQLTSSSASASAAALPSPSAVSLSLSSSITRGRPPLPPAALLSSSRQASAGGFQASTTGAGSPASPTLTPLSAPPAPVPAALTPSPAALSPAPPLSSSSSSSPHPRPAVSPATGSIGLAVTTSPSGVVTPSRGSLTRSGSVLAAAAAVAAVDAEGGVGSGGGSRSSSNGTRGSRRSVGVARSESLRFPRSGGIISIGSNSNSSSPRAGSVAAALVGSPSHAVARSPASGNNNNAGAAELAVADQVSASPVAPVAVAVHVPPRSPNPEQPTASSPVTPASATAVVIAVKADAPTEPQATPPAPIPRDASTSRRALCCRPTPVEGAGQPPQPKRRPLYPFDYCLTILATSLFTGGASALTILLVPYIALFSTTKDGSNAWSGYGAFYTSGYIATSGLFLSMLVGPFVAGMVSLRPLATLCGVSFIVGGLAVGLPFLSEDIGYTAFSLLVFFSLAGNTTVYPILVRLLHQDQYEEERVRLARRIAAEERRREKLAKVASQKKRLAKLHAKAGDGPSKSGATVAELISDAGADAEAPTKPQAPAALLPVFTRAAIGDVVASPLILLAAPLCYQLTSNNTSSASSRLLPAIAGVIGHPRANAASPYASAGSLVAFAVVFWVAGLMMLLSGVIFAVLALSRSVRKAGGCGVAIDALCCAPCRMWSKTEEEEALERAREEAELDAELHAAALTISNALARMEKLSLKTAALRGAKKGELADGVPSSSPVQARRAISSIAAGALSEESGSAESMEGVESGEAAGQAQAEGPALAVYLGEDGNVYDEDGRMLSEEEVRELMAEYNLFDDDGRHVALEAVAVEVEMGANEDAEDAREDDGEAGQQHEHSVAQAPPSAPASAYPANQPPKQTSEPAAAQLEAQQPVTTAPPAVAAAARPPIFSAPVRSISTSSSGSTGAMNGPPPAYRAPGLARTLSSSPSPPPSLQAHGQAPPKPAFVAGGGAGLGRGPSVAPSSSSSSPMASPAAAAMLELPRAAYGRNLPPLPSTASSAGPSGLPAAHHRRTQSANVFTGTSPSAALAGSITTSSSSTAGQTAIPGSISSPSKGGRAASGSGASDAEDAGGPSAAPLTRQTSDSGLVVHLRKDSGRLVADL